MADTAEYLVVAADKVKKLKDILMAQGFSKLFFVGSAVALVAVAAYSFMKGDDQSKDEEIDNSTRKAGGSSLQGKGRGSVASKKKRFLPERKFFTEEDQYSDDASTSNPNERGGMGNKLKASRFMSESEGQDARSVQSKDIDVKVKEEADDLYFAMLNKLNK